MNFKTFLAFLLLNLTIKVIKCKDESIEGGHLDLQKEFWDVVFTKEADQSSFRRKLAFRADGDDESFTKITPETFFFDTSPTNMAAIEEFKGMLNDQGSLAGIISSAKEYKGEINPSLWLRGFIGSILDQGGRGISPFVPIMEILPHFMFPWKAIDEALKESLKPSKFRACVAAIDENVGKINGIENKLWYFREDLMANSHHWYWHLEYPSGRTMPIERSGELFYYMHHNIYSRYHAERLSNGLPPITPLLTKLNGIVKQPYYSFLKDSNSGFLWTSRPPNARISDINALNRTINVTAHSIHRNRLTTAAATGVLLTPNGLPPINLMNVGGIDILSNTVESLRNLVKNAQYYGDYHIQGHILFSFIQDPKGLLGLPPGVMGDTGTAMRDPIFYPWHLTIDEIFKTHKDTFPPYTPQGGDFQLVWPGVFIENVEVNTVGRKFKPPFNTFYTFWRERRFDLSKGIDFHRNQTTGPVDICVVHLDHDEFEYTIRVIKGPNLNNNTKATIRIYLAPHFDENGKRYLLEDQRMFFFVLDTFSVTLSNERNIITRRSQDNSLTLEFVKSFRELENDVLNERPRCGCGWPHHLLLPKGKPLFGMTFDLFVMVTNGEDDAVVQDSSSDDENICTQGYLFCGNKKGKYPDSKPMNYPFDRKVYTVADFDGRRPVRDLDEYVNNIGNMNYIQVKIINEPIRKERAHIY